jgi:hypothetical protein
MLNLGSRDVDPDLCSQSPTVRWMLTCMPPTTTAGGGHRRSEECASSRVLTEHWVLWTLLWQHAESQKAHKKHLLGTADEGAQERPAQARVQAQRVAHPTAQQYARQFALTWTKTNTSCIPSHHAPSHLNRQGLPRCSSAF